MRETARPAISMSQIRGSGMKDRAEKLSDQTFEAEAGRRQRPRSADVLGEVRLGADSKSADHPIEPLAQSSSVVEFTSSAIITIVVHAVLGCELVVSP